jgi:[ribosomal protein S5]-alanine N-acetyltransferase
MTAGFTTKRLVAKPLAWADENDLAVLHADERVMATMGGGAATREESRAWIERNIRHSEEPGLGIFVFRDRETGEFVGRGALRRIEIGGGEEIEVCYALVPDRWRQGLATEMAAGLVAYAERAGLANLVAYTEPTNAASRRVMDKVGFVYERDVRQHGRAQVLYRRRRAER